MTGTTRRLLIAILAWPAGILAAVIWSIVSSKSSACPPGPSCAVALQPVSMNAAIEFLVLALAPGVFATVAWWRGRGPSP